MLKRVKTAVLVSGGGTNLQALIDAEKAGGLGKAGICFVVSSNKSAYAITRARSCGIEAVTLDARDYSSKEAYDEALVGTLLARGIELVILAGFLRILGPCVLKAFKDKIINVHPSLIPSFCGEGFYGLKVHEAALKYGVKVTGATVHLVSGVVDGGKILLQKAVPVEENDTPEILQKRVMEQAEWLLLPKAAAMMADKIAYEREKQP